MIDDAYDLIRVINVALIAYCVVVGWLARDWWRTQGSHARFLLIGLAWIFLTTGYGTVEAMVHDAPGGTRVLLDRPGLIWAADAVTRIHQDLRRHHADPPR